MTNLIILNIENQSLLKVFETKDNFFCDLDKMIDLSVDLLGEYLNGFTSLDAHKKKISIDELMNFVRNCENKYNDLLKSGFINEAFNLKFTDILGRKHGIAIQVRRTQLS